MFPAAGNALDAMLNVPSDGGIQAGEADARAGVDHSLRATPSSLTHTRWPDDLPEVRRRAIADRVRDHPDETYLQIAGRYELRPQMVSRIAKEFGVARTRWPSARNPELAARRASIEEDLRAGTSRSAVARTYKITEAAVAILAKEANIPADRTTARKSETKREAVLAELVANPRRLYRSVAKSHHIDTRTVIRWADQANVRHLNKHSVKRTTAEERRQIVEYAGDRPHLDDVARIAARFNRSASTIHVLLKDRLVRPAPSAAFGSARQQESADTSSLPALTADDVDDVIGQHAIPRTSQQEHDDERSMGFAAFPRVDIAASIAVITSRARPPEYPSLRSPESTRSGLMTPDWPRTPDADSCPASPPQWPWSIPGSPDVATRPSTPEPDHSTSSVEDQCHFDETAA
jgi:transposase-like protein